MDGTPTIRPQRNMDRKFAAQLIETAMAWLEGMRTNLEAGSELPRIDIDTLVAMSSVEETEEEKRAAKLELLKRFRPVPMSDLQTRQQAAIRAESQILSSALLGICPQSPERDKALEKVEEAMFWAFEAIARRSLPVSKYRPLKVGESRRG